MSTIRIFRPAGAQQRAISLPQADAPGTIVEMEIVAIWLYLYGILLCISNLTNISNWYLIHSHAPVEAGGCKVDAVREPRDLSVPVKLLEDH